MLAEFNIAAVEYLVVGGYAVAHHGYPRATGDMDFWIRRSPENAERVLRSLAAFGAPNGLVTREDLMNPDVVAQIGVEPNTEGRDKPPQPPQRGVGRKPR